MEKFIHQQNLDLFKKRLAEPHTDAEREVLMKLLADEQAKEPPPKNGVLKPRWSVSSNRPVSLNSIKAAPREIVAELLVLWPAPEERSLRSGAMDTLIVCPYPTTETVFQSRIT
jgi:hypothetical protein